MPERTKTTLSQHEAEEFVRNKLKALDYGELMEFSKRVGKSYQALDNFKNGKNKFRPTNLIVKCLLELGYKNVKKNVLITYIFDENTLSQPEAEEFVRKRLNGLDFGGLMELSKRSGNSYQAFNNFKNEKNRFRPTNLIVKCLVGFGYKDVEKKVFITYIFDET